MYGHCEYCEEWTIVLPIKLFPGPGQQDICAECVDWLADFIADLKQ